MRTPNHQNARAIKRINIYFTPRKITSAFYRLPFSAARLIYLSAVLSARRHGRCDERQTDTIRRLLSPFRILELRRNNDFIFNLCHIGARVSISALPRVDKKRGETANANAALIKQFAFSIQWSRVADDAGGRRPIERILDRFLIVSVRQRIECHRRECIHSRFRAAAIESIETERSVCARAALGCMLQLLER